MSDYVGRCLIESANAVDSVMLTLTYAPRDDGAERVLTKSHVQDFVRCLRDGGHPVRYLIAGQYGEDYGRAHWHALLFFQAPVPALRECWFPYIEGQDKRRWSHHWPHGHVQAEWNTNIRSIRYAARYCLRDLKKTGQYSDTCHMLSKHPPLGWSYFNDRAARYAALDRWPTSWKYLPPNGNPKKTYRVSGATRRHFIDRLVYWHGKEPDMRTIDERLHPAFNEWRKWKQLRNISILDPVYRAELFNEAASESMERREQYERSVNYLDDYSFSKYASVYVDIHGPSKHSEIYRAWLRHEKRGVHRLNRF